jgi:hypothetical protein
VSDYLRLIEIAGRHGWAVGLSLEPGDPPAETLSVYDSRPLRLATVLARVNVPTSGERPLDEAASAVLEKLAARS